ncbi:unnamed protein product [Peniophora sp. CBMAI 1063]|nr:unnamed protein product [Peniophora sp. CBMAI 1063]
MSAAPSTVPRAVAKEANANKWPHYRNILGNLDNCAKFTQTVDRLTLYLRNRKGYYQGARPEIVSVLETAMDTFERLARALVDSSTEMGSDTSRTSDILPGNIPCPTEYLRPLKAFRQMVRTVHAHIDEFKKPPVSEMDKELLARLVPIFSAFVPNHSTSSAVHDDNSFPAVEQTPTGLSPRQSAFESSHLPETPRSMSFHGHRFSQTPSRVTSPSTPSLLLPATSSPFSQSSAPARQRHITPRDDTPEIPDETRTYPTVNAGVPSDGTSTADTSFPTQLDQVPATAPEVDMSDTMVSDGLDLATANTTVVPSARAFEATHTSEGVDDMISMQSQIHEPNSSNITSNEALVKTETLDTITAPQEDDHAPFGTDCRMLCFKRGHHTTSSFTLDALDIPYDSIRLWCDIKNGVVDPARLFDSRCLSLVFYDAEDISARQNANPSASVESWFQSARTISAGNDKLRHVSGTIHGNNAILPAYFASQDYHSVDLSAWIEETDNSLQISHIGDLSRCIFALVLHRPTSVQETKARRSYAAKMDWYGGNRFRL